MDVESLKALVSDQPHAELLDALYNAGHQEHILPLLDVEIQRSSSRLQRLRERRNALSSPICRLLPELLSRVFFIYALDNDMLYGLHWTKLLFVCRRWLDVAMHTPELWSFLQLSDPSSQPAITTNVSGYDIDNRDIARLTTQLSRTGLWPLTIKANLQPTISEDKLAFLMNLLDRQSLCYLSLHGDYEPLLEIMASLGHRPRHTLRDLTINSSLQWSAIQEQANPRFPSFPYSILRRTLPQLTRLSVTGMLFDWGLVHGLRLLRISYEEISHVSFSFMDIVNGLRRCPLLEELHIELPSRVIPQRYPVFEAISLPRLVLFCVIGVTDLCFALLQSVTNVSSTAIVRVHDTPVGAEELAHGAIINEDNIPIAQVAPNSLAPLIDWISSHVMKDNAPIIRLVTLHTNIVPFFSTQPVYQVTLEGDLRAKQYADRLSWLPQPDTGSGFVHIATRTSSGTNTSVDSIFQNVLSSWPLAQATHLDARFVHSLDNAQWEAVFDNMPGITTVIVKTGTSVAQTLLDVLNTHLRERGQRILANLVFDAAEVHPRYRMYPMPQGHGETNECLSRVSVIRALMYCADASRVGRVPLDTVEIMHDNKGLVLGLSADIDWSELYGCLAQGFIYRGNMYNAAVGRIESVVEHSMPNV